MGKTQRRSPTSEQRPKPTKQDQTKTSHNQEEENRANNGRGTQPKKTVGYLECSFPFEIRTGPVPEGDDIVELQSGTHDFLTTNRSLDRVVKEGSVPSAVETMKQACTRPFRKEWGRPPLRPGFVFLVPPVSKSANQQSPIFSTTTLSHLKVFYCFFRCCLVPFRGLQQ